MTLAEYKEAVEAGIIKWFETEEKSAPTTESRLLLNRMCTLIKRGGKRARPELLYMTYVAYGGGDTTNLVDLGLALEFHHQFLLVHDDIIDKDSVRYDGPNIVGYYQQDGLDDDKNTSTAMALLAGDLLFSFSQQAIIGSKDYEEKQKVRLLQMLNAANINVTYGQQLDAFNLDSSLSKFSEEKLLLIHSLKSSSYSAQLPMNCAAALLKLSNAEREKIAMFAKPFGVLFQLVDDYSDYFNNNSAFNSRPKYRDFRQGKITYPLYIALTLADKKQVEFINHNLGNKDVLEKNMRKVIAILEDCGANSASQKYLEQFFTETMNSLGNLNISTRHRLQFTKMVERYWV